MSDQRPNAAQIRGALGLLRWENKDLAKHCGVTAQSISNIKNEATRPQPRVLATIKHMLEFHGIEFLENSGVRFQSRDIQTYWGVEGFKKFLNNVHDYVKENIENGKNYEPVCSSSVNDTDFIRHLGDFFTFHINRMNALKNFKHRILLREKPTSLQKNEQLHTGYREYRKRSPQDTANVPFYVYGNVLAILMLSDAAPQIVVISSALAAQAYREIFNALWEMAEPFE